MSPREKKFRFESSSHSYWLGERRLPGVTQILSSCGFIEANQYATFEKGTRVHALTAELDLHGKVDLTEYADLAGYVDAWIKAKGVLCIDKFDEIEQPDFDDVYGFGGTIDRSYKDIIVEIKTGPLAPWHPLQTAGYRVLHHKHRSPAHRRIGVYLRGDGAFHIENHDRSPHAWSKDRDQFLSALSCVNWRIKHGTFWEKING